VVNGEYETLFRIPSKPGAEGLGLPKSPNASVQARCKGATTTATERIER